MVKVWKPEWVRHVSETRKDVDGKVREKRSPIMSVSVQPGGKRFATGGQDGKVKIWNLKCVTDENDIKSTGDENASKNKVENKEKGNDEKNKVEKKNKDEKELLAAMSDHGSSVNCVRWSVDGTFLASGSDDCCINLWVLSQNPNMIAGNISSLTSGGEEKHVNVEDWKAVITFKGHTMDVTYVGWSPDSSLLASCSVDNTVRIWAIEKNWAENKNFRTVITDVVTVLKGHTGWSKCVAWDPVGTYLASASDDKTVIVWKCSDWQQETVIKEPLNDGSNTTFKRHISWSPDGVFLCMTHAYDPPRNVAYVVERNKWHDSESAVRFVGHPKPVSLAAFSPAIYRFKQNENSRISTVCAIACNERVLTVWVPGRNRALVVFRNLFKEKILDLAWSADGYILMACSLDGHVLCLEFKEFDKIPQVGRSLSNREVARILRRHYGDAAFRGNEPTFSETRSQLVLEEVDQQNKIASSSSYPAGVINTVNTLESNALKINSSISTTSANIAPTAPTPAKVKQVESVAANGKRRITPAFLSGPPSTPAPTANTNISLNPQFGTPLATGMMSTASPCVTNLQTRIKRRRVDFINSSEKETYLNLKEYRRVLAPARLPKKHSICVEREKGCMSMLEITSTSPKSGKWFTTIKRFTNGNLGWRAKVDGEAVAMAGNKSFSAIATAYGELFLFGSAGELLAPPIQLCMKVSYLSAAPSDGCYILCVLCNAHIFVWDLRSLCATIANVPMDPLIRAVLPSIESILDGVDNEKESKFDPIEIGGDHTGLDILGKVQKSIGQQSSKKKENMIVDVSVTLYGVPVLKCITPLLHKMQNNEQKDVDPVDGLIRGSDCSAYGYSKDMKSWCRISDASRYIYSDFATSVSLNSMHQQEENQSGNNARDYPLSTLQATMAEAGRLSGHVTSSECTKMLANMKTENLTDVQDYNDISRVHLEALIGSCRILTSAEEYKEWMVTYANRLSETSDIPRLHALCSSLLGPITTTPDLLDAGDENSENVDENLIANLESAVNRKENYGGAKKTSLGNFGNTEWKPNILGICKRVFLRDTILPTISRNREMQRLVREYYKAVSETLKSKGPVSSKAKDVSSLLEERIKRK